MRQALLLETEQTTVSPCATRPKSLKATQLWRLLILLATFAFLAPTALAAPATSRTNVDTTPTGAQVYLVTAGQEVYQGVTPLKLHRLPRGPIQLKFKKEGYQDLLQGITIAARVDTFVFNMQRAIAPARIELHSTLSSEGAAVEINGVEVGKMPVKTDVQPGRNHVVIKKDGYARWERWIDAPEGKTHSSDVTLTPLEAPKGEILVTSSPSGGTITLNGAPKGVTPAVLENLEGGPYLVEIQLTDYAKFSQTLTVEPGKRAVLDAPLVREKGETGEIKVLADYEDATIYLDGESIGSAPITLGGVRQGKHLVEARNARGYYAETEIDVRAGELTVVRLRMTQVFKADNGSIRVVSTATGAQARINNGELRALPATFNDIEPGTHIVTVEAPGFSPWTRTVTLAKGANEEVVAELYQAGRISVDTKDGSKAEVFLNGQPIGFTPYLGDVPAGTHTLLLQRNDGSQEEFRIAVAADREVRVNAAFGQNRVHAPIISRPMPFSARALAPGMGHASAQVSWPGWAFPLAVSAGGGIGYGMDINVQLRTAFDVINELEATYQWTFFDMRSLAAAVELGIGGGLGARDRSSFVLRPAVKGSVMVGHKAAITARVELLYHNDRLGPEEDSRYVERDSGVRLNLGLDVEFEVASQFNVMLSLMGDPVGGKRDLYEESFLDDPDPKIYFKAGVSYIF